MIGRDFKASYLGNFANSKLQVLKRLVREFPKPIYFLSKKLIENDASNYHYLVAASRFKNLFDFGWLNESLYKDSEWLKRLNEDSKRKKIYFPRNKIKGLK